MARFQVHDVHRVNKKTARRKERHSPSPLSRTYVPRDTTPGLIYRPPNGGANITKSLSLHENPPSLKQIREFAARYLDFNLLVSAQPVQWQHFCKDVAVEFPVLAKYPNVWVVRDYISHYLHGRIRERRISSMLNSSGSAREVAEVNSAESSAHSEVAENAEPAHAVNANRGRKKRPVIQNLAYVEIIQKRPVLPASRELNQASSSASSSRRSEHVPLVSEDSSEPVKRFLESLVPNLSYLWPVFDELGINNVASFDGMKSWPSESRDAMLMDFVCEGKITRFECEAIRLGLKRGL